MSELLDSLPLNQLQASVAKEQTGYFIFSLDTEMAWGYFDTFNPKMFSKDGYRERQTIERLLDIFDEFNITVTWAIVGHMFCKNYETCGSEQIFKWEGKYPTFEKLYYDSHPLLYSADVIETLLKRGSRHEIGFHGYTHKIFKEDKMSEEQARTEILEWLRKTKPFNIIPRSVAFPRNKIGYLKLFKENGFICYRGEELYPGNHYYLPLIGKVFRRFYDYFCIFSNPVIYEFQVDRSGLIKIPSSRDLFGFNRNVERLLYVVNLHNLSMMPLVRGIQKAASQKKIFHLFAHPHEFIYEKDFKKLRYLLEHVANEINKGRIQSISMGDLAKKVLEAKLGG